MTKILLLPLIAYAAAGLLLSLTVHLLSFVGLQPGGTALFFGLHVGIFPLWLPVVLIAMKMSGGMPRQYYWNPFGSWKSLNFLFAGSPAWMQYMTLGFMIYALVNFAIFLVLAPTGKASSGEPPAVVWRGFSGHWMVFYSAGLMVLTTAYRRGLSNLAPKCPNGHPVSLGDKFCSVCGVPL